MEKNVCIKMLFLGLCFLPACVPRTYFLIEKAFTWPEAQNYCRKKYTDLATAENEEEMENVTQTGKPYEWGHLWIGLHRVVFDSWKWSLEEEDYYGAGETAFRIWASGEPNDRDGNEKCTIMVSNGFWNDWPCSSQEQFICSSGTAANRSFIVVTENKSWSDAQIYCREHYTDLASVRNQAENDQINKMTLNKTTWIGLHSEQWMWSDGTPLSLSRWNPGKPTGDTNTPCVLLHNKRWEDADCKRPLYFICYVAPMTRQVVRVEVTKSDPAGNLEDAAAAMLKQMSRRLEDLGLKSKVKLSWRKQPDGKIFKLKEEAEEKKPEDCSLP